MCSRKEWLNTGWWGRWEQWNNLGHISESSFLKKTWHPPLCQHCKGVNCNGNGPIMAIEKIYFHSVEACVGNGDKWALKGPA